MTKLRVRVKAGSSPVTPVTTAISQGWKIEECDDHVTCHGLVYFAWRGGTNTDPEEETCWCDTELEAAEEALLFH